ncbi:hypothetical protein [Synoicihabitans lomoniglobus]|uniref:Lipoprotein n=1 Tax=Synoicihabitans lomoniglobus TaxID=2909285 RepID=A0AAE9ZQR4_9BACT|nr:hypothetical protein [Opitutaceae bacterium LMO-M01]WED63375.1 hypothetical protein PXH66_13635 [Opitutaceae bacterium LMO-M01]
MKPSRIFTAIAAVALLWGAGCASSSSRPRVSYPVTYQIQVGNSQVSASGDAQNLNVIANQNAEVVPGRRLYVYIDSPVVVDFKIVEIAGSRNRLVTKMEGTRFETSFTPRSDQARFEFSAARPNSSGLLQFTISDQPVPAPRMATN